MSYTHSPIDSSAHAEVLFEKISCIFAYDDLLGHYILTDEHYRYRVLGANGLSLGSKTIPTIYFSNDQQEILMGVKAASYNYVNGKIAKSEIGRKEVVRDKTENAFLNVINVPDVKVGTVVEYSFKRKIPLNVQNHPPNWYFQNANPTRWSEYEVTIPSF